MAKYSLQPRNQIFVNICMGFCILQEIWVNIMVKIQVKT